jgi:hypothetical protein
MWFTHADCTFHVSLVNSTHHIQLNWQSNRTGMLCCSCALFSLLLLTSATFLFALWVLSGVYCMWGAKGFLVGNTSPAPYPTPPLPPLLIPYQKSHPKKNYKKEIGWNSSTFTLFEAEKQWHQRDVLNVQKPSKILHPTIDHYTTWQMCEHFGN